MSDAEPITTIALFGRPHELWPAAAILGQRLPGYIGLTIVEDTAGAARPAALSLAQSDDFFSALDIDIRELLSACDGIFGLGTELQGLPSEGASFFTAPSAELPRIAGVRLHDIMLRAAHLHSDPDQLGYLMQPFRFAANAALAGKFASPDMPALSPARILGPTLQIDRGKYADFLKKSFLPKAANLISALPVTVQENAHNSALETVNLDNGDSVSADLFVDVSGALSGLASGDPQKQPGILPFDRIVGCFDGASDEAGHHNRRLRAMPGGIAIETPLRNAAISELLFSSADMDEAALDGMAGEGAVTETFDAYYSAKPWTGNLLRLGSASACLGPYHSADMRLLHTHVKLLAAHISADKNMAIEAEEFNHHQMRSLEEIRDFAWLPFVANRREDGLWKDMADAPPPESLQLRIDQFESRGNFVEYDYEIFDSQSWTELMIGLGIIPRRFDPMARRLDMRRAQSELKNLASEFSQAIARMPEHAEFMAEYFAENT